MANTTFAILIKKNMTKKIFNAMLIAVLVTSNLFAQDNTTQSFMTKKYNPATNLIQWPEAFNPTKSKFYVHNEIEINAKPEVVWNILTDVLKWESFYKGAKNVVLQDSTHKVLQPTSIINWETMGLKFTSPIKAFEPNKYLAWDSKKKNIQGYHAWVIVPTANGCRLVTAESQNGFLTFMQKVFQPKKLLKLHDTWLKVIKTRAEGNGTNKLSIMEKNN
jgi:hypothetical protein